MAFRLVRVAPLRETKTGPLSLGSSAPHFSGMGSTTLWPGYVVNCGYYGQHLEIQYEADTCSRVMNRRVIGRTIIRLLKSFGAGLGAAGGDAFLGTSTTSSSILIPVSSAIVSSLGRFLGLEELDSTSSRE